MFLICLTKVEVLSSSINVEESFWEAFSFMRTELALSLINRALASRNTNSLMFLEVKG